VTAAADPEDRIEWLDAIRGVALFGVLIVNLVDEFRISIFQQFFSAASADRRVEIAIYFVLQGKALALFSLLFGVGLAIQFERLSASGRPRYWLARRLGALLGFGLVHLLFIWNGDILTEYAVAGLLLLPVLRLGNPALLFAACGFFALFIVGPEPFQDEAAMRAHVALANQVYPNGGFAEVLRFSWSELPLIGALHAWAFPQTLALQLSGIVLWRAGVLRHPERFGDETAIAAIVGIIAGAALTLHDAALAEIVLAFGYGAALMRLAQQPFGRRILAHFAPLGRMAFTNYLMQSLIFAFVFFGWGLGQFGRMSAPAALVLGVSLYVAQIFFSKWWLRRYRFGPLEWLWRTLMYGAAQRMRRA
jgi:uncharacterized protein